MNTSIDNQKERGWILRILDRIYPDGLDQDTIKKQLIDLKFLTSNVDIRGNIAYLQDKGIVRLNEVGNGNFKRTIVTLTADGKDIIDGITEPPAGVDI